jgi:hypothetical protein
MALQAIGGVMLGLGLQGVAPKAQFPLPPLIFSVPGTALNKGYGAKA